MEQNTALLAGTPFVKRMTMTGLLLAAAGIALSAAAAYSNSERFLFAYLTAFVFVGGIAVTGVFFSILQYLVRAGWSVSIRRIPEFMGSLVPFLVILAIPIALGAGTIYHHWMHPEAGDVVLGGKKAWLSLPFFLLRLGVYCAVWTGLYYFIVGNSYRQDKTADVAYTKRNWTFSAPAVILYGVTITFAAFDLLMSLAPHWYSTIFGVYYFSASLVGALATMTIIAVLLRKAGLLAEWLTPSRFHDLGKLLFAFNVFWTYIAFSQYLLIWYANLPEEIVFFRLRLENGWQGVSLLLLVVHFLLPFVLLLSKAAKRNLNVLLSGAVLLLFAHAVDMYWLVTPNFSKQLLIPGWIELAPMLALVGLFVLSIAWQFKKRSAIPVNDPYLGEGR
jgi:hypothetical protein